MLAILSLTTAVNHVSVLNSPNVEEWRLTMINKLLAERFSVHRVA
jgi:hypothetical protein